jgi:hypothetical protein
MIVKSTLNFFFSVMFVTVFQAIDLGFGNHLQHFPLETMRACEERVGLIRFRQSSLSFRISCRNKPPYLSTLILHDSLVCKYPQTQFAS